MEVSSAGSVLDLVVSGRRIVRRLEVCRVSGEVGSSSSGSEIPMAFNRRSRGIESTLARLASLTSSIDRLIVSSIAIRSIRLSWTEIVELGSGAR